MLDITPTIGRVVYRHHTRLEDVSRPRGGRHKGIYRPTFTDRMRRPDYCRFIDAMNYRLSAEGD